MKRGRPTRLDSELTRKICGLLSEGISIAATCDALGVSESRYFEWLQKGEKGEKPYAKFREQTTRARANGKIALVRQILADKDWRGKSWYLERCWPDEFGKERPRPPELPLLPPLPEADRLSVDGAPVARLWPGNRVEFYVSSGEHIFAVSPDPQLTAARTENQFSFTSGRTYYFRLSVTDTTGRIQPSTELE
jgi:hypothetical protein